MNIKVLLSTFCCLFIFFNSFAQRQNVYFFKNPNKRVKIADSADWTRIISENDSMPHKYIVKEYYKNGKPKLLGQSLYIDSLVLDGNCLFYYPNGKKKRYSHYEQAQLHGDSYKYFPNGRVYSYIKYAPFIPLAYAKTPLPTLILAVNDSTGKELVINGNGYFIDYDDDFKTVLEEGNLKDGLKEGEWKGMHYWLNDDGIKTDVITFTEHYKTGKLISGESTDANKKLYKYNEQEVAPKFKGTIDEYLKTHIKYPYEAKRDKVMERIVVEFFIERDGSVTGAKVTLGKSQQLREEALRVINSLPKWQPAYQYGLPVRFLFWVPITFSL